MKPVHIFYAFLIFMVACKQKQSKVNEKNITKMDSTVQKPESQAFFPVTDYIKGQIFEIKTGGINPLKVITKNSVPDSSWIKIETLESELADFLSPVIDSASMAGVFSEKKFMDQTLDAITLTYDPIKAVPQSFALQHLDVYIDPNTDQVKRIYLLKKLPGNSIQQLTWNTGKGCRLITINNGPNNSFTIEKEITITWRF